MGKDPERHCGRRRRLTVTASIPRADVRTATLVKPCVRRASGRRRERLAKGLRATSRLVRPVGLSRRAVEISEVRHRLPQLVAQGQDVIRYAMWRPRIGDSSRIRLSTVRTGFDQTTPHTASCRTLRGVRVLASAGQAEVLELGRPHWIPRDAAVGTSVQPTAKQQTPMIVEPSTVRHLPHWRYSSNSAAACTSLVIS
jgi:hypothetical protein